MTLRKEEEPIMIYRDFQNEKLSALGFGAMRLPVIDGNDRDIDEAKTQEMVERAYEAGINYFDTAWGYHGGNSETVLGKCLAKFPRESFNIATKFPGYDLNNMPKVKEIFEQQLEKTGMEYFDFYLFHNVCEMNIDAYLNPEYGIFNYLMAQKKAGKIRHLGFSCHGKYDVLKRFLDAYGEHMEFCQLQLNYLDWTFQGGKEKVDLLNQMNIPTVFHIVGSGNKEKACINLAEQLGVSDRVFFHGWQNGKEKIRAFYDQADIFIMPSLRETFGTVYIEALSQGLPVLYTKGQGIDGYFEEGSVGYGCDPVDVSDAVDKVIRIANSYTSMSKQCIMASRQFCWEIVANQYNDVINTMRKQ